MAPFIDYFLRSYNDLCTASPTAVDVPKKRELNVTEDAGRRHYRHK